MGKSSNRLFAEDDLEAGRCLEVSAAQANYLLNVLRLGEGDEILLFDGKNGEWRGHITKKKKRHCQVEVLTCIRPQSEGPDLHYLFAPVKRARLDFMIQKATELGVSAIRPVMTRHTVPTRIKQERMRANAIEAAEQCGVLRVPDVLEPVKLEKLLAGWPPDRTLVYCDEEAPIASPLEVLNVCPRGPLGLLIGPEGGFHEAERALLRAQSFVVPISLGPRIMRSDTAAVAALALINAVLGDWR